MSQTDLHKLISLTFDEDSDVRKEAAKNLAVVDDPGAIFALLELTYDKDDSVREMAKKILDKKKSKESGLISLSELFSYRPADTKDKEEKSISLSKKKRLLYPIEQLFERHLGKEKAEIVKRKMMPSLEKVYLRSIKGKSKEIYDLERKEAVQEFLTTYLDAISDIPSVDHKIECDAAVDSLEALEHISARISLDDQKIDSIMQEADSVTEESDEDNVHEKFLDTAPDSLFKKAYEIMMYSGGDSKLMKTEMRRMIENTERDITMAFQLAKEKFKENKITKLTEIKEKMRNIITDDLIIVSKETIEFKKPRSSKFALRFLLKDPQDSEGVLYLFNGRGEKLSEGMKIKVVKGYAKVINDETALTIGKAGNVYIVV